MRTIFIALMLCNGAVAAAPASRGQALPSSTLFKEMLAKADTQLAAKNEPKEPYHYVAVLHYKIGDLSLDGTYEVLWAAPNHFRQELRFGKIAESDVVLNDRRYVRRNTPAAAYLLQRVTELTNIPASASSTSLTFDEVAKLYRNRLLARDVVCADMFTHSVEYSALSRSRTVCVDPTSDSMVSDLQIARHDAVEFTSAFDTYFNFGNLTYAGHVVSKLGDDTLDIRVEKMDPVLHFAASVFTPPEDALIFDWCSDPQLEKPKSSVLVLPLALIPPRATGFHGFYFKAAADGRIEEVVEIHRDGKAQLLAVNELKHERLPIETCSGKPVGYEGVQALWPLDPFDARTGGSLPSWGPLSPPSSNTIDF